MPFGTAESKSSLKMHFYVCSCRTISGWWAMHVLKDACPHGWLACTKRCSQFWVLCALRDLDRSRDRVAQEWNSSYYAMGSEVSWRKRDKLLDWEREMQSSGVSWAQVWSSRKRMMGGPVFIGGGAHGPQLITWAIVTSQGPHLRIFPKDKVS